MRAHAVNPVRAVLAAALLLGASSAYSEMYRWIDHNGSITYSNQLPTDRAGVRELTVVEDTTPKVSPSEQRTRDILEAERQGTPSATRELLAPGAAEMLQETSPRATREVDSAATPRITISPTHPEAVRDPCLRSADPKCYEKNRDAYVPYRGYSPSAVRAGREAQPPIAVGASSTAAAGGTIAGGAAAPPPKLAPPKSSTYALPPGSAPPVEARKP
jgi:hypothetical protein